MPKSEGVGDSRVGVRDTEICRLPKATEGQILKRGAKEWEVGDCRPEWGPASTGTLNDTNLSDEITTTRSGTLCWMGISLENLQNGDSFDIQIDRWNGSAWRLYKKYTVSKAGGNISIDTGGGAVVQYLDEINLETVYLDSTRKLRLSITAVGRDILYFYNLWE